MSTIDTVSGLHIFPVKGLHEATVDGALPTELDVSETGLAAYDVRDREFVMAEIGEDGSGLFVSQRGWNAKKATVHKEDKKLAVVTTNIEVGRLTIAAAGIAEFELDTEYDAKLPERTVRVHSKILTALDMGDEAADAMSAIVGRPVRLMRASREVPRMLSKEHHRPAAANRVAAADSAPLTLTSRASLRWLVENQVLRGNEEPVSADRVQQERYRGNIEIDGDAIGPFGEDYITMLRLGEVGSYVDEAVGRCPVPNNNQSTGIADNVSSRLLRNRQGVRVNDGEKGVYMDQKLNPMVNPDSKISVGDPVEVIYATQEPNVTVLNRPERNPQL